MPYLFATYNFQDAGRAAAAHDGMHRLEADGWEIVSASPTFTEMSVLWRKRPVTELEQIAAQVGEVHCDGCTCAHREALERADSEQDTDGQEDQEPPADPVPEG